MKRAPCIAFGLWLLLILVISSIPGQDLPPLAPGLDKVVHFLLFLPGVILLGLALRGFARKKWIECVFAFLVVAAIGVIDEWRQQFTPGRYGNDFYDSVANVLGALAGAGVLILGYGIARLRNRKKTQC